MITFSFHFVDYDTTMAQRTNLKMVAEEDDFEIIPDLTLTDKIDTFEIIGECSEIAASDRFPLIFSNKDSFHLGKPPDQ